MFAQYTVQVTSRDDFVKMLKVEGIPTAVHYPLPLNKQPAYSRFATPIEATPVSTRVAERVVSLPMHPYMDEATQSAICAAIGAAAQRPLSRTTAREEAR